MAAFNSELIAFSVVAAGGFVFAIVAGALPASLGIVALPLCIVALLAAIVALSARWYYFMFNPMLHMKGGLVTLDTNEPFYMSQNNNSILVRSGEYVYATAFIRVPMYSSATEMNDEQKLNFAELFARMVGVSKDPIRVSSQLYSINKDDYIARVNGKLNEAEGKYSTLQADKKASKTDLDRIKGEVTMWHNLLDSVAKANSQALTVYACTTAIGGTEEQAVNLVALKSDEIAAGISATLGIAASVVTGAELLVLIEPEFMIPPTTISELMKYSATQ